MTALTKTNKKTPLPVLLALQAPVGLPRSSRLTYSTGLLAPPRLLSEIMEHFFESVYDTRSESHLSRFVKVLIGDAGAGLLRKRYIYRHLSSVLATTNFLDLDSLYGEVFGFGRLSSENLGIDPAHTTADTDEWESIYARDAAYRSRLQQFSQAVNLCPTPDGVLGIAHAVLGAECRLYETYALVDDHFVAPLAPVYVANTYGDLRDQYVSWGVLDTKTYRRLEGQNVTFGSTDSINRSEFTIRPTRAITPEEQYKLTIALNRLKPANTLVTVDPQGVEIHRPLTLRGVSADSTYWLVRSKVAPKPDKAHVYQRHTPDTAIEQPKVAFAHYQGEAWSYNSDVAIVRSYAERPDGHVVHRINYQRATVNNQAIDFSPDKALTDADALLLGRYASEGILVSPVTQDDS